MSPAQNQTEQPQQSAEMVPSFRAQFYQEFAALSLSKARADIAKEIEKQGGQYPLPQNPARNHLYERTEEGKGSAKLAREKEFKELQALLRRNRPVGLHFSPEIQKKRTRKMKRTSSKEWLRKATKKSQAAVLSKRLEEEQAALAEQLYPCPESSSTTLRSSNGTNVKKKPRLVLRLNFDRAD